MIILSCVNGINLDLGWNDNFRLNNNGKLQYFDKDFGHGQQKYSINKIADLLLHRIKNPLFIVHALNKIEEQNFYDKLKISKNDFLTAIKNALENMLKEIKQNNDLSPKYLSLITDRLQRSLKEIENKF